MKVKKELLQYIEAPKELRHKLAMGQKPQGADLKPDEMATLLFVLSHDSDPDVASDAVRSFEDYPTTLKLAALEKRLDPHVIKKIIELHPDNEAILIMAALNPGIDKETLLRLAETGPEEVVNALAEDGGKLRSLPALEDALKKNPVAHKSIQSTLDSAKEKPAEVPQSLTKQANTDETNIFKLVLEMKMAQKIKLALTGNKSARELLVKDANKIVASAVLKNPRITEDEVLKIANSKGIAEDLLRQIGRNKDWLKNYSVRMGMVMNPKTPLQVSMKLLDSLYEKDLQKLSKSKNVASVLVSTARRKLESKAKK